VKSISANRKAEINTFSAAVRATGERLAPCARDAERIRLLARELQAGVPAVKKWWYAQNAPRGAAAAAILRELDFVGVIDVNKICDDYDTYVTHTYGNRM
jgi:hypothetical protein